MTIMLVRNPAHPHWSSFAWPLTQKQPAMLITAKLIKYLRRGGHGGLFWYAFSPDSPAENEP